MPEPVSIGNVVVRVVLPTIAANIRRILGKDPPVGPFVRLLGGPTGRPPPLTGAQREAQELAQSIAPAVPVSVPSVPAPPAAPPPVGTPPIFPTGPAANDPIFRQRGAGLGRLLGRLSGIGGAVLTAADILILILEKRQQARFDEILREQSEQRESARRRAARDQELREITIRGLGTDPRSPQPDPPVEPAPSRPRSVPQPIFLPDLLPLPDIVLPSARPEAPSLPRVPVEIPQPTLPGVSPVPTPRGVPRAPGAPSPVRMPRLSPSIFLLPFLPFGQPAGVPSPGARPAPLTGPRSGSLPSPRGFLDPIQFPQPQPQTDPARERCRPRKCDDDLEDDRTECFKGLYREGLRDTDFTQWVQIDCITGKEID